MSEIAQEPDSRTIMAIRPECGHAVGAVVLPTEQEDREMIGRWAEDGFDLQTVDTEWFRDNGRLCPQNCDARSDA